MHRILLFVLVALLWFACLALDAQRSRLSPTETAPPTSAPQFESPA